VLAGAGKHKPHTQNRSDEFAMEHHHMPFADAVAYRPGFPSMGNEINPIITICVEDANTANDKEFMKVVPGLCLSHYLGFFLLRRTC
jgi:hypothetical protein